MAYELTDQVLIDRPPSRVWPYVADLDLDQRWRRPYVTDVHADGDPLAVGTTITGTTHALGRTDTYANEITDVDPPRRLAWRGLDASGGLMGVRGAYELEPQGTGTQFRLRMTYESHGTLGRLLGPAMVMFLRRRVAPRFMRQLRELAERDGR
jgi:uncharacterized protein YndB with AHSA1/START domain